ncbi:MAG TPA: hypothetical protein PLD79_01950 [Halothiobacillus sp.]|nr:MAG: hypothetical protein B7Z82_00160 [Halothiobacillus sp. 20-54-6]HQT42727.1 hypothetical protein [Halothiobacillus sp.]
MNLKRFISSIMLLFAVWLPLDNALAAAVIEGCPMMSDAFARGWQNTWQPQPAPQQPHCHESGLAGAMVMSDDNAQPVAYHCVNGCEHCSLCLLLGSVALPSYNTVPVVSPVLSEKLSAALAHAHQGVTAILFRPPIG